MALPKFRSIRARRNEKHAEEKAAHTGLGNDVEGGNVPPSTERTSSDQTLSAYTPGVDIKRATRTRKHTIIASSFFFFVSVIFLILTEIGSTYNKPVLRSTWLFSLNLSEIFPTSIPNSVLINSIARTLGLHDFYNVGLWGFCEGYLDEGTTYCSPPTTHYFFNPVEILLNELLAGATIALPAEVNDILNLIRIISYLMSGFFLTGACMLFVSIFLAFLPLYSRWWSLPVTIWTFIGALLVTAASVIGTVYAIIFRNTLTSQPDLNIAADLGVQMFGFMWTAAGTAILAFLLQLGMSCCCASRRDVRKGRRKGSKKAYGDVALQEKEAKPKRFMLFGRRAA